MDLFKMHERMAQQTPVSYDEMTAVACAIARQPREHWPELVAILGLDGRPVTLNRAAKSRYRLEQRVLDGGDT